MRTAVKIVASVVSLLAALLVAVAAPPASAASLTEVTNFGANPSNLRMHLYVPASAPAKPAIVVAVHYCTGSGPAFYSGSEFASLADRYGFVVIYPSATRSGNCFDVSSAAALRHDGGSDPVGIVSMVRHVQQRHGGDPDRVYVTGVSSGAMTTNVLLGAYPDVFKAGAAFSGVPFGCFATTDGSGWNSACANGTVLRSPAEWGDLVRAAYPGYSGPRPRMQLWHGTGDSTLRYPNLGEEIDQWTNVLGVSRTPVSTDRPRSNWVRTRYGDSSGRVAVEAYELQGVGHDLLSNGMAALAVEFFGLTGGQQPTTPAPGGPCRVTWRTTAWNTGHTSAITIANTGSAPVDGWSLGFTLPGGQTIASGWNATYSPSSGAVTATDVGHNGRIAPNESVEIGLQATHTGDTAKPTSFTLNGSACTTA
ncbi:extracellular catalytic domain type 1 short-chain-length polyhydroxyalkanoate depolymerase [Umezawaea beigongshangensis]|uniref:extracellular catalytic domain type 1 short-chain-length polyhydroxyalkanoate depolymerase n=1 Tax=Umezawaea beigongshangensis TaxID=2780383 RepID=UPI0018F241CB|nr:PHB depolymerase family esterase [Umezawaea beigongshangensis]